MCVIISFQPHQMISKAELQTACFNNWHSFGLVTRIDNKLDIKRVLPKSGEVDPNQVFQMLEKDIQFERHLHLRHNTAGATTLENTHPFDVFYDPTTGEQLVFMHNGTLYDYKSKKLNEYNVAIDDDSGPSDTKNFVDEVLVPYCQVDYGTGKGDVTNKNFVRLIRKFWPLTSNRGVLISATKGPLFLGEWKTHESEGTKLKVSNDDYFKTVQRGPEAARRFQAAEAAKKAAESKGAKPKVATKTMSSVVEVARLQDHQANRQVFTLELSESLKNITNDWDVWSPEGLRALAYATKAEFEELYSSKHDTVMILDLLAVEFEKQMQANEKMGEKLKKAELRIERMANELRAQKIEKDAA